MVYMSKQDGSVRLNKADHSYTSCFKGHLTDTHCFGGLDDIYLSSNSHE
jgi:hypothetical protein